MAGSNELCGLTVITKICKKEHIRGNAEILKQLLAEFCETPVTVLVDNSDVNDLGGGVYEIDVVSDPRDGYIAITEDLTFYEFDGTAWTLKFAGLGGFIASASDNGDDTYTFTSFDGSTNFNIAIPILSVEAGPGIDVDVSDPKRPSVGLDQASQDSLDLADSAVQPADSDISTANWVLDEDDMVSDSDEKVPTQQSVKAYVDAFHEYLVIDENQIFSKRGANEIEFPSKDIIISADSTQPNRILGTSSLRSIVGGYDNTINDNLASSIFGSHHSIIAGGGHNLIAGGSTHIINSSSYSSIIGGRNNTINGSNVHFLGGCENLEIYGGGVFGAICARNMTVDPAFAGLHTFIGPSTGTSIAASASNYNSVVGGQNNTVAGQYGFIGQGVGNTTQGIRSTVLNASSSSALGDNSCVINGPNNTAHSYGEVVCGIYATNYVPNSSSSRDAQDRVFSIGIGHSTTNRRNAYTAFKNGRNQFRYINIEQVTPGTKIDGDIWFDGTDLKIRVGGMDKTFTLT